jgi:uncharacterized Fe-S cluster-containing protein
MKWNFGMLNNDTFECNSTRLLNYLKVLGYVEQEKTSIHVFGVEGLQQLLKEYERPEPPVYTYIVNKLPLWWEDLNV